jgi:hypothetical protein
MISMAVFVTCMSLTKSGETAFQGMPVTVDEALHTPPMYLPLYPICAESARE